MSEKFTEKQNELIGRMTTVAKELRVILPEVYKNSTNVDFLYWIGESVEIIKNDIIAIETMLAYVNKEEKEKQDEI